MYQVTSRGCSRAYVLCVLWRGLEYVRQLHSKKIPISFPFPDTEVEEWLIVARNDCNNTKFQTDMGGIDYFPDDPSTYWTLAIHFFTWWKNNVERKTKFLALLTDACYSGSDDKLLARSLYCQTALTLSLNIKNHFTRILNQQPAHNRHVVQIKLSYAMPRHMHFLANCGDHQYAILHDCTDYLASLKRAKQTNIKYQPKRRNSGNRLLTASLSSDTNNDDAQQHSNDNNNTCQQRNEDSMGAENMRGLRTRKRFADFNYETILSSTDLEKIEKKAIYTTATTPIRHVNDEALFSTNKEIQQQDPFPSTDISSIDEVFLTSHHSSLEAFRKPTVKRKYNNMVVKRAKQQDNSRSNYTTTVCNNVSVTVTHDTSSNNSTFHDDEVKDGKKKRGRPLKSCNTTATEEAGFKMTRRSNDFTTANYNDSCNKNRRHDANMAKGIKQNNNNNLQSHRNTNNTCNNNINNNNTNNNINNYIYSQHFKNTMNHNNDFFFSDLHYYDDDDNIEENIQEEVVVDDHDDSSVLVMRADPQSMDVDQGLSAKDSYLSRAEVEPYSRLFLDIGIDTHFPKESDTNSDGDLESGGLINTTTTTSFGHHSSRCASFSPTDQCNYTSKKNFLPANKRSCYSSSRQKDSFDTFNMLNSRQTKLSSSTLNSSSQQSTVKTNFGIDNRMQKDFNIGRQHHCRDNHTTTLSPMMMHSSSGSHDSNLLLQALFLDDFESLYTFSPSLGMALPHSPLQQSAFTPNNSPFFDEQTSRVFEEANHNKTKPTMYSHDSCDSSSCSSDNSSGNRSKNYRENCVNGGTTKQLGLLSFTATADHDFQLKHNTLKKTADSSFTTLESHDNSSHTNLFSNESNDDDNYQWHRFLIDNNNTTANTLSSCSYVAERCSDSIVGLPSPPPLSQYFPPNLPLEIERENLNNNEQPRSSSVIDELVENDDSVDSSANACSLLMHLHDSQFKISSGGEENNPSTITLLDNNNKPDECDEEVQTLLMNVLSSHHHHHAYNGNNEDTAVVDCCILSEKRVATQCQFADETFCQLLMAFDYKLETEDDCDETQ